MATEDITRLTELQTHRVSLVHRGANKRKFAVRKAEDAMNEEALEQIVEIVKTVECGAEKLLAIEEIKKQLNEKEMNDLKAAMRLVGAHVENPKFKNIMAAMEAATKMAPGEEYPKPKAAQKQSEDEEKYPAPAKMAKAEKPTPEMEAVTKALEQARAEAQERIEKAERQTEEVAKALASERDLRLTREFIAKAKETYGSIPGKPEDLGVILKSLHAKAPDEAAKVEVILKSVDAIIAKSALLGEVGRSGAPAADSAIGALAALADQSK